RRAGVNRMRRRGGLPKKLTPRGKPGDTPTWARVSRWSRRQSECKRREHGHQSDVRMSAAIAAKTLSRVPPSGATEDAELKALARRREQLERELAADPVLAAELKAIGRPDPVAVRDALPADAALVDLFEYDAPSWAGFFQSGRRLAAFVVRPGRPIVRVELGAAGAVRDDLDGWSPWSARATTPDGRVAAARLRERLWVPLAP